MQQLGSIMEEISKVPGRWEEAKQMQNFKQSKIQSELLKDVDDDEHRWLQCNADAKKTGAIFNLQQQKVETTR